MKPYDPHNNRRMGAPLIPQRSATHTPVSENAREASAQQGAANIARGQIEQIYGPAETPVEAAPTTQPAAQPQAENPYHRTHSDQHHIQADQWQQYHSAWQNYYQKYYERYYVSEVQKARQTLESKVADAGASIDPARETSPQDTPVSRDEALYDLRQRLLGNLREGAKKVRGSRHFVPITAAACVMLVFLFLQYNRVLFSNVHAFISPGNIDPVNIIVDPTTTVVVGNESRLIIPKINVDVPVIYNTTPDQASQLEAMTKGVAWFGIPGANSKPGQVGNTVLSGHSSNDVIDQGDYKFIFARLDKLEQGDLIYTNYKGKRYTYRVTKKEVVKPTQVDKLVYETDKPVMTLITCTPLGTALNRLLVTAEQISPSPEKAAAAPDTTVSETADMPGNSPTFIERLFGRS